jgi:RNA polymerase sigma-70 factor (ECF subfamily)
VHASAITPAATDWPQICVLYDALLRMRPSPVVELNRGAAIAMRDGPAAGLALMDELRPDGVLDAYHLFHSARAELLRRLGRAGEAADAYRRALQTVTNPTERRFLERRLREVGDQRPN